MKYGLAFAILASLLLWAAAGERQPVLMALYAYAALSPALLAVAYVSGWPWLLGKDAATGKLRGWSLFLGLPYHLLNGALLPLVRQFGLVRGAVEVSPNLWLGPRLLRNDAARLPEFAAVIDLCAELPEAPALRGRPGYLCIPILDATPPQPEELNAAINAAVAGMARGPVYVHCASGHSRSALVAAGVLLHQGKASTVDEAITLLRAKRPGVNPSRSQREVLRRVLDRAASSG